MGMFMGLAKDLDHPGPMDNFRPLPQADICFGYEFGRR
jgi:hypothetical protein